LGEKYPEISDAQRKFIDDQKLFFVATATADSRVNVSPKGLDSLRVLNKNRVVWINLTGSGNETSVHIQENPRMTIMLTAFEGNPLTLRLYGNAKVIHKNDPEWDQLFLLFDSISGARQIFDLSVDLVHASCGMSVPLYSFVNEREQLKDQLSRMSEEDQIEFWRKHNEVSLDGQPTHILSKNS